MRRSLITTLAATAALSAVAAPGASAAPSDLEAYEVNAKALRALPLEGFVPFGFGLEGVSTAAQRAALLERALRHLGVRGGGG